MTSEMNVEVAMDGGDHQEQQHYDMLKRNLVEWPHLIVFRYHLVEFALAELDSLLIMNGLKPEETYLREEFSEGNPYLRARFPSEEVIRRICLRAILIKGVFHVWGVGRTYEELLTSVKDDCPMEWKAPYFEPDQFFALRIDTFGVKISAKEAKRKIMSLLDESPDILAFKGKVKLSGNDSQMFWVHEYYDDKVTYAEMEHVEGVGEVSRSVLRRIKRREENRKLRTGQVPKFRDTEYVQQKIKEREAGLEEVPKVDKQALKVEKDRIKKEQAKPNGIILAREIVMGEMNKVVDQFSLKTRAYIGPTSMDCELSFLMANLVMVKSGSFVFDPFVGTGSLMVPCSYYDAICQGGDIDFLILHGKGEDKTFYSTFDQYQMTYPELVRFDFSPLGRPFRHFQKGVYDAIICDPPYGIRAGAKKSGVKPGLTVREVPEEFKEQHFPATQPYPVQELLVDLVDAAARLLRMNGRIIFVVPVDATTYTDDEIPKHPCLRMVSNCWQALKRPRGRRFVVMEKVQEYNLEDSDAYADYCRANLSLDGGATEEN